MSKCFDDLRHHDTLEAAASPYQYICMTCKAQDEGYKMTMSTFEL